MMTREEAEKELIAMLEEAEGGPSYSMEEVDAYMRELLHPKNQIYLTGDTHGQFERIISFCERQQVQPESTFIILGDVGLNYYGDRRDNRGKDNLTKIPITFFCIHGNHEMRPSEELGYQVKEYHGGKVWVQPEYPNLVFAIDGEIYDFFGHSCIVIGGAYSVDKYYRLARGYNWFEDEQPSDEIKEKVERTVLCYSSRKCLRIAEDFADADRVVFSIVLEINGLTAPQKVLLKATVELFIVRRGQSNQ